MPELKVGDQFPSGVVFKYVPFTTDDPRVCGIPQNYDASKEFAGKTVVLVSVPGAFTPGCQGQHIPPYIEKLDELRSKGVDIVAVIAFNDAWVMSAWSKINGVKNDDVLFMSDTETKFSSSIGWMRGERNSRWAMLIGKDGMVKYAEQDLKPGVVEQSSVDAVLAKL